MSTYNFAIEAVAVSSTKNMFAASSDGFVQTVGGYEYVSPSQSLAASATVTFVLPEGLLGYYFAQVEATPFNPALTVSCVGGINSAITNACSGFCNTLAVPGGTWTIACVPTGITVTASAGMTGGPYNIVLALNKIGSSS